MFVRTNKNFDKQYQKLPPKLQDKFKACIAQFLQNPSQPALRHHALKGEFEGFWSINITGDYRAIYEKIGDVAVFSFIGTHGQLYG